jgi:hypothetical protein
VTAYVYFRNECLGIWMDMQQIRRQEFNMNASEDRLVIYDRE